MTICRSQNTERVRFNREIISNVNVSGGTQSSSFNIRPCAIHKEHPCIEEIRDNCLTVAFAANTQGDAYIVNCEGTKLTLPDDLILEHNYSMDTHHKEITVHNPGVYKILYNVNLTHALNIGSRICVNGRPILCSTIEPNITRNNYFCEVILKLEAYNHICLELYSPCCCEAKLQRGCGSMLSITKIH